MKPKNLILRVMENDDMTDQHELNNADKLVYSWSIKAKFNFDI